MFAQREIRFGRYRLHPTQGLTRGSQEVRVTPRSLAVLGTLLERPGEVVTREELFRAVWQDTAVSEAALTTCIQELRRALADDARHPKFIETVHRRGFRFLADSSAVKSIAFEPTPHVHSSRSRGPIVGRDSALQEMSARLARACEGQRQVVFVTGEPGIGKTALVDLFLTNLVLDRSACHVARADCVEQRGAGEAYQPLLEALMRLCTQPDGAPYLTALRRCAPTWLAQLPALQTQAEYRALRRRTAGATAERMLRELTDAFETRTRHSLLVLCLEDLHWSDVSTLDWIRSFAQRPEPARVLIVGTYRSGEARRDRSAPEIVANDLGLKGLCREIALDRLDAQGVREYVMTRCPPTGGAEWSLERLAMLVYERTEGNPLFVVHALSDLMSDGVLVAHEGRWATTGDLDTTSLAIPVDVQRMIVRQVDRLDAGERSLLEVASLTRSTCSTAAIAAGAGVPLTDVESTFATLARRNAFLRESSPLEWPDGTLSASFEFLHALYREVLSARVSPARRVEVHRAIGTRLEVAHGEHARELAAELAFHFEHGRDFHRAIAYLQQAAENAQGRSAHDVAQLHYRRALALLDKVPADNERDDREIALRSGFGHVVMQTHGWGASEVEAAYARVRELSEARDSARPQFAALWNLWIFYITRAELDEARAFADRLLALAGQTGDAGCLLQAHHAQWTTLFTLGDFASAATHTCEGIRQCEAQRGASLAYGSHDAGICAHLFQARVLARAGRMDAARAMCDEALSRARRLDHPFTLAFTLMHAAGIYETLRDPAQTRAHAAEARHVAREHGLSLMLAWATCYHGWSITELGDVRQGLALLSEGVESARVTGSVMFQPHMLRLAASAQAANGLTTEALQTIEQALAISDRTGEWFDRAELLQLEGQLRLGSTRRVPSPSDQPALRRRGAPLTP